mmetsp:Transcript_80206/g.139216  ORF Transcript_80206/g.139216 Transcript_80206/m.139216 type:complete len:745 (+) Transcript_80206:69-2303(+)
MRAAFLFCVFVIPEAANAAQRANIVRSEGLRTSIRVHHAGGAVHVENFTKSGQTVSKLRTPAAHSHADNGKAAVQMSMASSRLHNGAEHSVFLEEGFEWPVFGSPANLSRHPYWKKYLKAVYGDSVEDPKNYPINMSTFWVLREELMPEIIMVSFRFRQVWCPRQALDVYGNMSGYLGYYDDGSGVGGGGHDPPGALWIYHPHPYPVIAEGKWVEVTHCTYGLPGADFEQEGYWMYYAPGSGVFYNVGKTKVYENHQDAVTDLLGQDAVCVGNGECQEHFYEMVHVAAKMGLTSLQFVNWSDMRCGPTAMEILDVHNSGNQSCLPSLRGGLKASCACACNSDSQEGIAKQCLSCSLDCSSSPASLTVEAMPDAALVSKDLGSAWRFGFVFWEPPNCQRDSAERQNGICIIVALLTVFASFCFLQQCYQDQLRSSVTLAILSAFFFGLDNFLIGYAGSYLCSPRAHMSMMFLLAGSIAILLHVLLYAFSSAYRADWKAVYRASNLTKACIGLTSAFIGLAELCSNIGFTRDPQQSGPHQALVCGDVLIVVPFFYWYAGEVFTRHQLAGCLVIVLGTLVMSEMSRWFDAHVSLAGFLWVGLSMIFYGFSIITLRLTGIVPWQPRLILILGGMGFFGFMLFVKDLLAGGLREYYDAPRLLMWPLLNALTSNLGIWAVSFAYEVPGATVGVLTAIVDSNSMVMMLMNRALLSYLPSAEKLAGMIIILSGCAWLAFPECGCLDRPREAC